MMKMVVRSTAVWIFLLGRVAMAAPVVLNFEDLPDRTSLIAQYANRGITFNQPQVLDFQAHFAPPGFARSGTRGIEHCFAQEFCTVPVEMQFTAAQRRVKVWVGYRYELFQNLSVVLTGFNAQGAQVAQATVQFTPRTAPYPITSPLEAVATTASIVRANIVPFYDGQAGGTSGVSIDDLEFDTEGPPPVCNATDRAFVGVIDPAQNFTTQIGVYPLRGRVVLSGAPLQEATLRVVFPDGTSTAGDLLSSGIVQTQGEFFGPTMCSPLRPGTNRVSVTVANCQGGDTDERTVIYTPLDPATRFVLKRIQFLQAIQDLSNLVPLIAGKRTVARVYLELGTTGTTTSIFGVRARMTASRTSGGPPLPGPLSITSLNTVVVKRNPDPSDQFNLSTTLNFELPPEWITEGTIHTRITNISIEGRETLFPCTDCTTPFQFGVARFENAPPVRLILFQVPWFDNGTTLRTPGTGHFDRLESWIRRAYPTGDLRVTRSQVAAMTGEPYHDFDCDDVNARLFQQIAMCACDPQTHFYGLVDDNGTLDKENGFMRGCSRGIPSRVACGPSGASTWGWDNDGSYADWYGAHELAHTYDRRHPGFCNDQPEDDEDYPYSGGRIGNVHHGFDVGDAALGFPMMVLSPATTTDVMTYCDNEWISDYTYRGILARLRAIEATGGGGGRIREALMVQGRIDLVTNETTLRPFIRLDGLAETPRPPAGAFVLELRDAGGASLALYPFDADVETDPEPGENLRASFDAIVPWVEGTRTIIVHRDGVEVARRAASASAPQVRLVSAALLAGGRAVRVQWTGSDADRGDALSYTLQYTNDGGEDWIPIETGLIVTQVDVPITKLPGGSQARFRIIATDGVNTSQDIQDEAMNVPLRDPTARILHPAAGSKFAADEAILLQGEGSDLEDGHLRGEDLVWSSDSARVLGTGASLSLSGLPPGIHVLGLTARDSSGAIGTDGVEVEVLPVPLMAQAEVDSPVGVGSAIELDGSGSTGQGRLEFTWSLLERPAGSTATVARAREAVAGLTVDRTGLYLLQLVVEDSSGQTSIALPTVRVVTEVGFRRGEVTGDGDLDISDSVRILAWLFTGAMEPDCVKAADGNDDGVVDLSDGAFLLNFLFLGGRAPPAPFPGCGADATVDRLACQRSSCP